MKTIAVLLLMLVHMTALRAQGDSDDVMLLRETQQRQWIADTRESHQKQFAAREAACYQRFAVNDCLQESRRLQRDVMADLRRQEILINDAQRRRRAAVQLLRSDARTAGAP